MAPDGAPPTTPGSKTAYEYKGNTVTDPAGHYKTFTMDAFGNLIKVLELDGAQTNTGGLATTTYIV